MKTKYVLCFSYHWVVNFPLNPTTQLWRKSPKPTTFSACIRRYIISVCTQSNTNVVIFEAKQILWYSISKMAFFPALLVFPSSYLCTAAASTKHYTINQDYIFDIWVKKQPDDHNEMPSTHCDMNSVNILSLF